MSSIIESSISYLNSSKIDVILQVDFLKAISKRTHKTTESIRGTVMGVANYKILENSKVNKTWRFARNPARFVRKGSKYEKDIYDFSYNTKEKRNARKRIFSHLPRKRNPTILTLASNKGYCVKTILKRYKNPNIINVEQNEKILKEWIQGGIKTKNYLTTLEKFVKSSNFKNETFDFVNLDLMGYASMKSNKTFTAINQTNNCKCIAITLQYLKKFRNHGRFVEWAKEKYYRFDDPTLEWIKDVFSNYTLDDVFVYNRDKSHQGVAMRVFIFKES